MERGDGDPGGSKQGRAGRARPGRRAPARSDPGEGSEAALRRALVEAARGLSARGLTPGTSGNLSVRVGAAMLITPTGVPYDRLAPGDLPVMRLGRPGAAAGEGAPGPAQTDAEDGAWEGPLAPSSEWRFHRDILLSRPEIGAVVHAHSPYATALAMARRPIPAGHYMIAAMGGPTVRCAKYATFGTAALSKAALKALRGGRLACLLANHGMIALGRDLSDALWRAEELEVLAAQHWRALAIGGPVVLPRAEIARVRERFKGYV